MSRKTRPPKTLSGLIRLAVNDARKLDRDAYWPVCNTWHEPSGRQSGAVCRICLAGAVIAGTLGAPTDADVRFLDQIDDTEWVDALTAIDHARTGKWRLARMKLGHEPTVKDDAAMASVAYPLQMNFGNWEEFETHLHSLEERAAQLEAAGL